MCVYVCVCALTQVAFALVQIYNSTKNENLKATTASTIARLLRHSPQLVAFSVDKFGVRLFIQGLADSSSKVRLSHTHTHTHTHTDITHTHRCI